MFLLAGWNVSSHCLIRRALCHELLDVFDSADANMAKSNTQPVMGDFANYKASAPQDSVNGVTELLAVVNFANDNDTQAQAHRFLVNTWLLMTGRVVTYPPLNFFTQRVLMCWWQDMGWCIHYWIFSLTQIDHGVPNEELNIIRRIIWRWTRREC